MKCLIAALVLLCAIVPATGSQNSDGDPAGAVRYVLQQQQDAWNRHDLEGFMRGYWNSTDLTFVSGTNVTRGWRSTLERYRRAYQAQGKEMGKLELSELEVQPLGPGAAFARGAFHLAMSGGQQPHGRFTLVFRKFPEGWRIVHDHTCSAE
jgi:uncharacterized protein (TIGR02246 family)